MKLVKVDGTRVPVMLVSVEDDILVHIQSMEELELMRLHRKLRDLHFTAPSEEDRATKQIVTVEAFMARRS